MGFLHRSTGTGHVLRNRSANWGRVIRHLPGVLIVLFSAVLYQPSQGNGAPGERPLRLGHGVTTDRIGDHAAYLEVRRASVDLRTARDMFTRGLFMAVPDPDFSFGLTHSGFWLTSLLRNEGSVAEEWVLDAGRPYLRKLEVWLEVIGQTRKILDEDDETPFYDRAVLSRHLVSEAFSLGPGEAIRLWLYAEFDGPATLPLSIYPSSRAAEVNLAREIPLAIFYAAALVLLVFILTFAVALRSKVAALYAGFFLSVMAYNAQLDGTLFAHVWPALPEWNAVASHVIGLVAVCFALLMAREFIKTGKRHAILNGSIMVLLAVAICYMPAPIFLPLVTVKSYAGLIVLGFLVLQMAASLAAVRDRIPGGAFYLLGSLVLFGYVGAFTVLSQMESLLPPGQKEAVLRYGQLLDGFVFSLAVARQTWVLRRRERQSRDLAVQRSLELDTTRHDIRQPLLSLQIAVERMSDDPGMGGAETRVQLSETLAYLQQLVDVRRPALDEPAAEKRGSPDDAISNEEFPLSAPIENAVFMFTDEATSHGIDLRAVKTSLRVHADPVDLLRVLTNLVSNAIMHSGSDRILIGVRRRLDGVAIDVVDRGKGILDQGEADPDAAVQRRRGEGLGLEAVSRICAKNGWAFSQIATNRRGSHFRISGLKPSILGQPVE
ncbi:sensor histidine kinase [Aquibium oceanicum]|uniref:sensor histidine kinase n=1 Tax=Aquibium oceanicum TaxID=1670800 RepID=UPI0036156CB8